MSNESLVAVGSKEQIDIELWNLVEEDPLELEFARKVSVGVAHPSAPNVTQCSPLMQLSGRPAAFMFDFRGDLYITTVSAGRGIVQVRRTIMFHLLSPHAYNHDDHSALIALPPPFPP